MKIAISRLRANRFGSGWTPIKRSYTSVGRPNVRLWRLFLPTRLRPHFASVAQPDTSPTRGSTGPLAPKTCFPSAACTSRVVRRDGSATLLSPGERCPGRFWPGPASRHGAAIRNLTVRSAFDD
jgi:hypothetical protein